MPDNAKRPDPDLQAEAAGLLAELRVLLERTKAGQGETLRFTLTVPKELVILAAWMAYKADRAATGEHGPLPRPIHLRRESDGHRLADWYRARDVFWSLIQEPLAEDWNRLADETHPLLFRPDDGPAETF